MKNIVHVTQYHSPYGKIFMGSDGKFLTGLWFEQQKYFPEDLVDAATNKELSVFAQTREWLNRYFQRIQPDFTPAIRLDDTPFRVAVWEILQTIPYGRTTTYKQIAEEIARRKAIPHMSAQAVGGAVGHNPISIIIPCHRVIGSNGSLTGYAGGLQLKQQLLALEQSTLF